MNRYLVLGLFALVVVVISLVRLMSDHEFFRVTAMKKAWGRTRGLAMHFLGNVGLPLIAGIIFMSYGVVDFDPQSYQRETTHAPALHSSQFIALLKAVPVTQVLQHEPRLYELFICP